VVNADQTVIILWDPATKTEHFIRQASFKSEGEDFGFLVPTPAQPELEEAGNEAFPYLAKATEPARQIARRPAGIGCGCGATPRAAQGVADKVTVLAEKLVAGFHAVVLQAESGKGLVAWLNAHGYAFSPEVEAWAKPYIDRGWKITALKIAKANDARADRNVAASSLRLSFHTDRPLFPYREPDPRKPAAQLNAKRRLLRIYFLADARYRAQLTEQVPWTGTVAWANWLTPEQRNKLLEKLKLPDQTGPAQWWLTEFENDWPYQPAPADVYFSRDTNQRRVEREPIIEYVAAPLPADVTVLALVGSVGLMPLVRRFRSRSRK
jgi:hypothetical protein